MKIFIGIIVGLILALAGFTWLTLHWSYADGERAGLLQKFSRRGDHITVHYEQRKWIPTSCFGDTEYFVTSVQRESPAQPQPQTPQALPQTPQTQPPAPH